MGAYVAEGSDPNAVGTRLAYELIGGNLLYATFAKALPRIASSDTVQGGSDAVVSDRQQKLFDKINELYADYGTDEQYEVLVENLTSDEMSAALQEAFPDVDFTAAQRGGDALLSGVEAVKASGEPALDAARKKAEAKSMQFMNDFIKGLISDGDPESLRKAAALRISVFDDTLRSGLETKMAKFLEANDRLAAQPGQEGALTKQELSEQLYDMVGNYITAAGNKERELWNLVPNIEIISPMSPDTPFQDLPKFLQAFEEVSYGDFAVQNQFKKSAPVLFEFIENARRDLGLTPMPTLSDPEIASLDKFKDILDTATAKLAGFDDIDVASIMDEAAALPVGERASFFRNKQNEILETLNPPQASKIPVGSKNKIQSEIDTLASRLEGTEEQEAITTLIDELESQLMEQGGISANPAIVIQKLRSAAETAKEKLPNWQDSMGTEPLGELPLTKEKQALEQLLTKQADLIALRQEQGIKTGVIPTADGFGFRFGVMDTEAPAVLTGSQKLAQRKLANVLDKAADYSGAVAAAETRATQRAGEASTDVQPMTADRLAEVRSKLLRQIRSLAADPATSDEARRLGLVAQAIADDLDVDGFGEAYDIARAYTAAKHDFFTRTIVGQVGQTQRSGAGRLPAEVTFEMFIKSNPSLTLSRTRQLQGMAEFADQQGLPSYLPEEVISDGQPVFTTTTNLIDSYLRGLKKVASKEVFDPKTGKTRTVINAGALEEWKAKNKTVLEAFPQLKIDLADAASSQRAVEVMEQTFKKGQALAKQQTDLSRLIQGMSPTQAVANAYNSETPLKAFRNLFALRRMGSDGVRSRQARMQSISDRSAKIGEAGLETSDINDAMGRAVLEHAYLAAGGEGSFNPAVFYQTMFGKMPKADQSLMDVADQFNIFPEKVKARMKFMAEQMMRVQQADAAGKLLDPDYMAGAGPIAEFYIGVLGSAAGTQAFKASGGSGPGAISAAGVGARELRKFMLELPQVAKLRAIDLMFTDAQLIGALMNKPSTAQGKKSLYQRIVTILSDKIFNTSASMAPFVVRELAEEEDRGTGSPLAEDPSVEIPALIERQNNPQGSIQRPPVERMQLPSQQIQQAPRPVAPQPLQPAPQVAASGPVDRERFAALFPEDRDLMSGIGSLGGVA